MVQGVVIQGDFLFFKPPPGPCFLILDPLSFFMVQGEVSVCKNLSVNILLKTSALRFIALVLFSDLCIISFEHLEWNIFRLFIFCFLEL